MAVILGIVLLIAFFYIALAIIGLPLVIAEKITQYRKGLMSIVEKKQWKWVFIIWSIVFVLLVIILSKTP